MQASIGAVTLAYIRHEILSSDWLPFGSLFAALQVDRVSYLWSMELWATITADCLRSKRRLVFVLFLPFCIVLAAAVGPSTATAMVPRQIVYRWFEADISWNATQEQIFPATLSETLISEACRDGDDRYCPWRDWPEAHLTRDVFNPGGRPEVQWQPIQDDRNSVRHLTMKRLWEPSAAAWSGTVAIVEHQAVAKEILDLAAFWAPARLTGSMIQPYVRVDCEPVLARPNSSDPIVFGSFSRMEQRIPLITEERAFRWAQLSGHGGFDVRWIATPQAHAEAVSIFALLVRPPSGEASSGAAVSACTVKAAWGTVPFVATSYEISLEAAGYGWQRRADLNVPTFDGHWNASEDWPVPLVSIREEWAQHMSQELRRNGPSSPLQVYLSVDSADCEHRIQPKFSAPCKAHQRLLAMLVATGMALTINTGTVETAIDYRSHYDSIRSHSRGPTLPSSSYRITATHFSDELGYSFDGIPIKLSIATLSAYCAIVIGFIIYTLSTGTVSTSWDSVAELVTLALNSRRPDVLKHTTAGVSSMSTFRHPVNIREVEGDRLEIVFKDEAAGALREKSISRIKVNGRY